MAYSLRRSHDLEYYARVKIIWVMKSIFHLHPVQMNAVTVWMAFLMFISICFSHFSFVALLFLLCISINFYFMTIGRLNLISPIRQLPIEFLQIYTLFLVTHYPNWIEKTPTRVRDARWLNIWFRIHFAIVIFYCLSFSLAVTPS